MNAQQVTAFVSACWPQAMQSPLALAVRSACAADEAGIAIEAAAWCCDDTDALLADAEALAETWSHLGAHAQREQVDAHLESGWPGVPEELREQIVSRVCAG